MDATLDKVAKAIDTAQPQVEAAIEKTFGKAAASKAHDVIEKVEAALKDPVRGGGEGERLGGRRQETRGMPASQCRPPAPAPAPGVLMGGVD